MSNEVNLKEMENNSGQEKVSTTDFKEMIHEIKKELSEVKVLGDHSYVHVRQDKINEQSTSSLNKVSINSLTDENVSNIYSNIKKKCNQDDVIWIWK